MTREDLVEAAIYARKSTDQLGVVDEARSVARQIEGARAFIAARGWALDEANIYIDDGVSGSSFERPGFERMMQGAKASKFDAAVHHRRADPREASPRSGTPAP